MNARDFMEMNKQRAQRGLEENKDRPRSQAYIIDKAILNLIDAYEMEVGYENDDRKVRGYWEGIPLIDSLEYWATHKNGTYAPVTKIDDSDTIGAGFGGAMWAKDDVLKLHIERRRNGKS